MISRAPAKTIWLACRIPKEWTARTVLLCLIILCLAFFSEKGLAQTSSLAPHCQAIVDGVGQPRSLNPETKDRQLILCRDAYVAAYNTAHRVSDWVVERLDGIKIRGSASRKRSRFREDADIGADVRAKLRDYRRSGFDRGHMAPAADFKFRQKAMDESFYLSNMAPQIGVGFNRGIWRLLEEKVRDWARLRGALVVITGPIYKGPIRKIKQDRPVSVPSHFYKIIYDPEVKQAIAFVMANQKHGSTALSPHIVSVDAVEADTHHDFLPALEDALEARIEAATPSLWPDN